MAAETIEDLYREKLNIRLEGVNHDLGHFNVFRQEDCHGPGKTPVRYTRRDYYKIALMRGPYLYHYGDKTLEVTGSTLIFFNPQIPYTFERLGDDCSGYFCIFKEPFFGEHMRGSLRDLPMYAVSGKPAYMLSPDKDQLISEIFEKMITEMNAGYAFKFDLIRNYIMEIIHNALKLEPSETLHSHTDSNTRITQVFTELLERQFPIETPGQLFTMKSARNFADKMNVHTNHLNRAVKTVTGKTTTNHIAERIAAEAIALLKHTGWNISEISYSLGFSDPAHFSNFFRKQTSHTPGSYR